MIKYYSDCTLPMPRFITATVDHDLTALLIEPVEVLTDADREALSQAWLSINSEWVELMGDPVAMEYGNRIQSMADIGKRLVRLRMAVESLRICVTNDMIEVVREEFPDYDFNPADADGFAQDLENVLTELVSDEIEFERLQKIAAKEQEKQGAEPPQTRQGFTDLLFEINHKEGVKYSMDDLTAADFASLIKRLKQHYKTPPKAA